jgi:hypothetical protein
MRADSGFFDGNFLVFLEERALPRVVVARLTSTLKRKRAGIQEWTPIDGSDVGLAQAPVAEVDSPKIGWPSEVV